MLLNIGVINKEAGDYPTRYDDESPLCMYKVSFLISLKKEGFLYAHPVYYWISRQYGS